MRLLQDHSCSGARWRTSSASPAPSDISPPTFPAPPRCWKSPGFGTTGGGRPYLARGLVRSSLPYCHTEVFKPMYQTVQIEASMKNLFWLLLESAFPSPQQETEGCQCCHNRQAHLDSQCMNPERHFLRGLLSLADYVECHPEVKIPLLRLRKEAGVLGVEVGGHFFRFGQIDVCPVSGTSSNLPSHYSKSTFRFPQVLQP